MKRLTGSMAFLLLACAAVLTSSCSKDDLFTTLANEASPDQAITAEAQGGHWAVKTRLISDPLPPED